MKTRWITHLFHNTNTESRLIFLLYFFLLLGGFYNALSILQSAMIVLAPFFISTLGILAGFLFVRENRSAGKLVLLGWLILVFVVSVAVEDLGVRTGLLFGEYHYGDILGIKIGKAPLVIGFAWISTTISSWALAVRLIPGSAEKYIFFKIVLASLLMVFFDFLMEPAAIKIGYWLWEDEVPPLRNYLMWGMMGVFFLFFGNRLKVLPQKSSSVLVHLYIAQVLFFLITLL
ncbi:MAG: hypothetical protein Kow00108_21830 [Calditrichia bacterium]